MARDGSKTFRQIYSLWLAESQEDATAWLVGTMGGMRDDIQQLKDEVARLKGRLTKMRKRMERKRNHGKA